MNEKNMDQDLQKLLELHNVPAASNHLERRIIEASFDVQQRSNLPWWKVAYEAICDNIYMPEPVFAMAVIFILGVSLGIQGDVVFETYFPLSAQDIALEDYLLTADDIGDGDFL